MNQKHIKLCVLSLVVVGLFMGTAFLVPTELTNDDANQQKQKLPDPSVTPGYFDRNGTGTTLGVLGESQLRMANSTVADLSQWSYLSSSNYSNGPFGPYMPQPSSGMDWKVKDVNVEMTNLVDNINWVPSSDFGNGWTYWSTSSPKTTYSDTYWDQSHPVNTVNQQIVTGSGAVNHPSVAGSLAFETPSRAGYIQVNSARRTYTFRTNDPNGNGAVLITTETPVKPNNALMARRWGYMSAGTPTYISSGGATGITGYTANWDSDSTPPGTGSLNSQTSGWVWGDSNCRHESGIDDKTTITSNPYYDTWLYAKRTVRLWYQHSKTSTSADNWYAFVGAKWDQYVEFKSTATQSFYFVYDGSLVYQGLFNARVTFLEYEAPLQTADHADTLTGTISFKIKTPSAESILHTKDFQAGTEFNIGNINTQFSAYDKNIQSFLVQNGKIDLIAEVIIRARARSNGWRDTPGNVFPRGDTGTSTVSVPIETHRVGIKVRISNMETVIREDIRINNKQDNPMEVYIQTTSPLDFSNREITSTPVLSFDYHISSIIKGSDGGNSGLTPKVFARIRILKGGTWSTIEKVVPDAWSEIRGIDVPIYGMGCSKFNWELSASDQAALNQSTSFYIEVGFKADINWEMHYTMASTGARIWFKNLTFQFETVPRADKVGLKLHFKKGGESWTDTETVPFIPNPSNQKIATAFMAGSNFSKLFGYTPAGGDGFYFTANTPLKFTYTLTINVQYETWDWPTQYVYVNNDKSYFISNNTFRVPYPINSSGGRWYHTSVNSYYNDNFNLTFVLPKFLMGGETYWKVDSIKDKNHPTGAIWGWTSNVNDYWANTKNRDVLIITNPPNIYGNTNATNGKVQTMRMDYQLFSQYTATYPGLNISQSTNLILDMKFYHPSAVQQVNTNVALAQLGSSIESFYNHEHSIWCRAVYASGVQDPQGRDNGTVKFTLRRHPNTTDLFTNTVSLGTLAYANSNSGYAINMVESQLGDNYYAFAELNVQDLCGTVGKVPRGVYKGGVNLRNIGIYERTSVTAPVYHYKNGTNIVGNLTLKNSNEGTEWPASYTNYFDTPNHPGDNLEIRIVYKNSQGNIITGATGVLNAYYYISGQENTKVRSYITRNMTEVAGSPGTYACLLDLGTEPYSIPRAYYEYNITISKQYLSPQTVVGNFSIAIPTQINIVNPPFGSAYYNPLDNKYYMNYEKEGLMSNSQYNLGVTMGTISKTGAVEYLRDAPGNFYYNNIKLTYNLTSISEKDNITKVIDFNRYVAYDWFLNQEGQGNITDPNDLNPVNGTFASSGDDILFISKIRWPSFDSAYYTSNSEQLTEWKRQQSGELFVLHYNYIGRVRVNRTSESAGIFFQPNDVIPCQCLPFEGQSDQQFYVQRETNMVLNNPTTANWTRIIPTNYAIDNNPYSMGKFNNDSANIMDFELSNKNIVGTEWSPEFQIVNYRSNLTDGNRFRIRVMLNCSVSDLAAPDEWFAGYKNESFIPVGPINETTYMYGYNMTQSSNTSVFLSNWNGTSIPLTADWTNNWSTQVEFSDESLVRHNITAVGPTYVSDWIYWNSTDVGIKKVYINAIKAGFAFDQIEIGVNILPAPVRILNGTIPNPAEDTVYGNFTSTTTITTTKIGISKTIKLNITDVTNALGETNKVYLPVEGATISVHTCNKFEFQVDESGEYWDYVDDGNGTYTVNLKYMHWPWDINQEHVLIQFNVTRANYQPSYFAIRVNIEKRNLAMEIVSFANSTMKMIDPSSGYSETNWNHYAYLNATLRFKDLETNNYIEIYQIEHRLKFYKFNVTSNKTEEVSIVETKKLFERKELEGNPVYEIKFYPTSAEDYVGLHHMTFALVDPLNYTGVNLTTNFTITKRDATVDFLNDKNNATLEFYVGDRTERGAEIFLYYRDRYIQHPDGVFVTYQANILGMTLTTNFTNTNASVSYQTKLTEGIAQSVGESTYQGIKLMFNTVGMSVRQFNVNCTIVIKDYNPVHFMVSINIVNASTRFGNVVMFKSAENTLEEAMWDYASNIKPGDILTSPWGYKNQFRFEYKSDEDNEILLNDGYGSLHIGLSNVIKPEAEVNHTINIETGNTPICYLWYNCFTLEDYVNITFTVTIWKDNYNPISRDFVVTVVPRATSIMMRAAPTVIGFRESMDFLFTFYDVSSLNATQPISNAKLFFDGEEVAVGNKGTYQFPDAKADFMFEAQGAAESGTFMVSINTLNLSAGREYSFNIEIGKLHFANHWINHSFRIRPTLIKGEIAYSYSLDKTPEFHAEEDILILYPEVNKEFYIWVRPYVEVRSTLDGDEMDKVYLDNNDVNITVLIRDDQATEGDLTVSKNLKVMNLEFHEDSGCFVGKVSYKWTEGVKEIQLSAVNSIICNISSNNPSYTSGVVIGRVLVPVLGSDIPPWMFVFVIISFGLAAVMTGMGINAGLKRRIPYVLRMIDESIEQIKNDKFPVVGVMTGRTEFVIKQVLQYLDDAGIVWSISNKYEEMEEKDMDDDSEPGSPALKPYSHEEIVALLAQIESLSADQRALFIGELKRMDRKEQDEFIEALKD